MRATTIHHAFLQERPRDCHRRLLKLPELLDDSEEVVLTDWVPSDPATDRLDEGDRLTFTHGASGSAPTRVRYAVVETDGVATIRMRAAAASFVAHHLVITAPATGDGTEVVWRVEVDAWEAGPVPRDVLRSAAQLASSALDILVAEEPSGTALATHTRVDRRRQGSGAVAQPLP